MVPDGGVKLIFGKAFALCRRSSRTVPIYRRFTTFAR